MAQTKGNAQIQAALIAGQALCDPKGGGKHVIQGNTVFQQGPGNNQNPPWSKIAFAGGTVTNRGAILCVLASIIDMIGLPSTGFPANPDPGQLALHYKALTGTPPTKNYPTNTLIKTILNDYQCAVLPILPTTEIFQYMLSYNGYIILYGAGGENSLPPFLNDGHFVYIRSYDPVTDLYFIGQSFGNLGALLDHVRGYKITDLIKQTATEGGVITAFGTIENNTRRLARETAFLAANPKLPSTAYIASSRITLLAKNLQDKNRFQWLGLGTTTVHRDERKNNQGALFSGGNRRYTFADTAKLGYADTKWGDGGTGKNDNLIQFNRPQYATVPFGVTPEGYRIFKDINMENENNQALLNGQSPPNPNVLFIRLVANPFGDEGDDEPASIAADRIPYTKNPDGSTVVPVAADRYVIYGTSPEGYAVYINLTQAQLANNITAGTPRFIRLDGNYVSYITIPNPKNTGPGSSEPSLITQIAPGNHTIYKYDKNIAFGVIANISIPGAVAAVGQ